MNKEISNIVVIDRDDYDELVEKANRTDAEINERAEHKFMRNNEVPVRIEFNQHRNSKNFIAPIGFIRCYHGDGTSEIYKALNELEPKIKAWMDENLSMFDKELKDQWITKKNCVGLSKRVENLELRCKGLKIKNTFLFCYAAVISTIVFLLLSYLK